MMNVIGMHCKYVLISNKSKNGMSKDLESSFSSWSREETPLKEGISFIDVNFPYKSVASTS